MSDYLINQLMRHEGCELKPYKDTVGKLTIGIGRNLDDMGITQSEAMFMLKNDIDRCTFQLMNNIPYWNKIDEVRKEVLINMCFNLGFPRLKGFKKMFSAIMEGDYNKASEEMKDSKWARQVKGRAKELSMQMKNGRRTTEIGG